VARTRIDRDAGYLRFIYDYVQVGTEEMIHPIVITKCVRVVKKLIRDRLVSIGILPRSVTQVTVVRAPVGRTLIDPYPWHRHERDRSPGRRQPEGETKRRPPRSRGR